MIEPHNPPPFRKMLQPTEIPIDIPCNTAAQHLIICALTPHTAITERNVTIHQSIDTLVTRTPPPSPPQHRSTSRCCVDVTHHQRNPLITYHQLLDVAHFSSNAP